MSRVTKEITVGNLVKLRECAEKKRFSDLAMRSKELDRRFFVRNVLLTAVSTMMQGESEEKVLQLVETMLKDGYKDEWFAISAAKSSALKKSCALISRMISFLFSLDAVIEAVSVPYYIEMLSEVSYRGNEFNQIKGCADFVLKYNDGHYEAVSVSLKKPTYSYAARKDANRVENAVELICMRLGLEARYPGITCSLYYLKNKDDKGSELKAYESKRGKNIIRNTFADMSMEKLMTRLYDVAAMSVNVDCDSCVFSDVCKFPRCMRDAVPDVPMLETAKEETAVPEVKEKPHYTDPQREVIYHKDGPMNVIAVPGAGKTFSLVQRMLHLIRDEGVKPSKILFVTYTRKACEEIKERVEKALGTTDERKLPNIYTFNALGFQILKDNPALLGRRVKLAEKGDQLSMIRSVLSVVPEIKGVSYDGFYSQYGIVQRLYRDFSAIEEAGEEVWKENCKGDAEGILRAYHKYKEVFEMNQLVTYDQQISLCNELFEKRPELAKIYSRVYQYIMVDEFQDVSQDNAKLIYTIARYHNNIVVVGDDDQSIYGFRGGSNKFMLNFANDFEGAKTIIMNDNFRSNDKILEASESLIANNTERFDKAIVPHAENAYKPILLRHYAPQRMVGLIATILKKGYQPGDIAILGRYNKTLFQVSDVLSQHYKVNAPKDYLIDDPVFLALHDLLTLCFADMEDERSTYRLFSWLHCEDAMVKEDRGKSLMENVLTRVGLPKMDLSDVSCAAAYKTADVQDNVVNAAVTIFECLKMIRYVDSLADMISAIVQRFFGAQHVVTDILTEMCDERAIAAPKDLYFLMHDMVLFCDDKRIGYTAESDAVNLLTAHDSKGKEFPVVIVYAAEEFADTEEERRLLYVAMTRAKNSLFVTESEYSVAPLLHECEQCMAVC